MSNLTSAKNFLKRMQGSQKRPPFEAAYPYIFCFILGYALADLSLVYTRPMLLPEEAPPKKLSKPTKTFYRARLDYDGIKSRNVFNHEGLIPPPLSEGSTEDDGPATLSSLPLKLLGTIVHANPEKSVATIEANSDSKSYRVKEEIPNMAEVILIERRKVTFRNRNNGRKEYIELPEAQGISFTKTATSPTGDANAEVTATGGNDYNIQRSVLDKYLTNLSDILSKALMRPNIVPGSGGEVQGFTFVKIDPGSIYEKLGFKPGDIIKSVDGEPVNSPTKAMELFNSLKNSDRLAIGVERGARTEEFRYQIQ